MTKNNSLMRESNRWLSLTILFCCHVHLTACYLLLVDETQQPGDVIFNASIHGSDRIYKIDLKRSAPFVESLVHVDHKSGRVSLLEGLQCNGLYYPSLFIVHIESTSSVLKGIDYFSLPLRVVIVGRDCPHLPAQLQQWVSETQASYAIPWTGQWRKICLRQSQFVNSLKAFLPETISTRCSVSFHQLSDDRFEVEQSQGDLVASRDLCLEEPLWRVSVAFVASCQWASLVDTEHKLRIVYHHEEFDDKDIAKRVRRELRNQSPFFEQHLYVASVLEECQPPVVVTTVRARDPENGPVMYSMTSLLDSRTQAMFDIDQKTGVVSTKVQLDRELVDVHYFRVTATDDTFPPRSGTTMLQINVLDANDHSPVFEMTEYDASVRESVSVGTTVITLKATDQDIGKNAEVVYSVISISGGPDDDPAFKIDPRTGVMTTRTPLDRETAAVYTLVVAATDSAAVAAQRRSATASVVVRVLDDNDNYPQFSERTYNVALDEDLDYGDSPVVCRIRATDADEGVNAAIRYAIISGNTQSQFAIDSLTGDVSLVKPLDYETIRAYRLVVRAQDGGSPARSNATQILVNVNDVNDNAPRFYSSLFQESVPENVPVGYSVVRVQAYDADEGKNAEIEYALSARDGAGGSTDDLPLAVDPHSGWVFTTGELDREVRPKYMFQVIATDKGVPPQSASANVVITVQDVNDNDPVFEPKIYEAVIAEDDAPGTPVATVTATDADEDNRLHYEITAGNTRNRFAVTSQNGVGLVTVAQPLDYKQERRFALTVTATDSGGRRDAATVRVNVTDANNFAPVFENAPYAAGVFEDVPLGTTVLVVSATDNDVGLNAQVTYAMEDETFAVNQQTGAVVTTKMLDRETVAGYLLTVTASDGGSPPLSDTTDVEITVLDVNDNYPVFRLSAYVASVPEDALVGTSVVQVSATDADVGLNGKIRYSLGEKDQEDGSFVIDPTSGVIRTNKGLDRESVAFYDLEAYAVDRGSPTLSTSVPVNIRIEDVNDNPPAFESDKIILYVPENSPVGSTVGLIRATDPDEGVNALIQYSIAGGEDAQSFSLVTRPGADAAELISMVELDYEGPKKRFELVVRAASPPLRSDARVEVVVTDVNDNAPKMEDFQVVVNNYRDCFPSGAVGRVPAFDADVSDKLRYRILSGNNAKLVALDENTGQLQLSPQLNTNVPKVASMEVSVTDGVNEVKAVMTLSVRLITEEMLFNSITVRLNQMTEKAFLSPLLGYFIDGLAAIIPCPKENIFVFSVQNDADKILNVSFSIRRPDVPQEQFYAPQFLQERVYLNRAVLARLATVQVLPFDDDLCVREPCLNFEECLTVLQFGNASHFISSDTVLFRPINPVTTFACRCPRGFTGSKEHYLCDTEVNLCYSSPCKNGGDCTVKEGGYTCVCSGNFTGENCDMPVGLEAQETCSSEGEECNIVVPDAELCELKSRSFTKTSFLTFPSLKQRHRLHLKLKFATRTRNGLLLYNGRYNELHDFIALEIVEEAVQFSFSLGSDVTEVKTSIPGGVSDGNWHTVVVNYYNKTITLSVDDCDIALALKHGQELGGKWACASYAAHRLEAKCASPTETCHRFLDLTGPLQLGGVPAESSGGFQMKNAHFEGCLAELEIDRRLVDLDSFATDNNTGRGCPEKRPFCASSPCRNGGTCLDRWATFRCICPPGYGDVDCGRRVDDPWSFSGGGRLSFNPLLRPIQLPWLNALSVRTLQADALLMAVRVGQNSSAVVALKGGHLAGVFDERVAVLKTTETVADGEWHRVEVEWNGAEVRLSVDYGASVGVFPFGEKIQGLYVGKILIGGPDDSYSSLDAGYNYLDGCVQDVRIGTQQTALTRPTARENVDDGCLSEDECRSECPAASKCVVQWGRSRCECDAGRVGPLCVAVCSQEPCDHGGVCVPDGTQKKGYRCDCNATSHSGEHCEVEHTSGPCPSTWWGHPVCGPCQCDVEAGHDPECDRKTGQCRCRENHYTGGPSTTPRCLPCECYHVGAFGTQCDRESGQCRCRDGVIGRKCDSCPNAYAEVTLNGCEVVYDGCPRSASNGIWWPRTVFGSEAIESCPKHSHGKASRRCDNELGGWQEPDMFNCTSDRFVDLRQQLSHIERGELLVNTFVSIKLAHDLRKATNLTEKLYGADVLVTFDLVKELIGYEKRVRGLNLTHSQDKDYIGNLVQSVSRVLDARYSQHWQRIAELTGEGSEELVGCVEKYIGILSESQHDTYTSPFEIVSPNTVLGLDVVTPESLYGYESDSSPPIHLTHLDYTTESVILPDTSLFLEENKNLHPGPSVAFPKYNNYLLDKSKFDQHTKIHIPLKLLGIKSVESGEIITRHSLPDEGAVISYAQHKQAGRLLPKAYDDSVVRRWGVEVTVGSPLISVSVLVPDYNFDVATTFGKTELPKVIWAKQENGSRYNRKRRSEADGKMTYKSLSGVRLTTPVRLQIWLDAEDTVFNDRSNPQCVHWTTVRGFGEWSRVGCITEIEDDWYEKQDGPILVNCSCNHLTTFAVLVDVVDLEYIPEPSLLEDVSSYSCFSISLPLLLGTYLILALIRGLQTNSNTIRKNLVLCVFLAELLYFIALKARRPMVGNEFSCKLVAIGLHYLWLAAFSWTLVDAIHLYRMLTEMRDINHGPMRFYYSMGYVGPAVVVSLAVGVRAHQYGNYYFCWVSLYESVVWSLVGPIGLLVAINLFVLVFSIRAAFTLQDHVLGFGNLRTLLWVSVIALPLLGATWVLALLDASERHPLLTPFLSLAVLVHAGFALAGYCFANNRVRQNLLRSILRCMGKKVPLIDNTSVVGVPSTSSQNISAQSRSALAYHSSLDPTRRNIGISASSTTSRSTTKTGSSPYRSDTHLRHTSTSTSNYNSTSDVPSYLRGFEPDQGRRRRGTEPPDEGREEKRRRGGQEGRPGDSDSDSDGSEGRSLDLASSHSSDDDESGSRRHRSSRGLTNARQGYLPNITEHVSRCGTPPSLNVVTNSQLFPAVPTNYGSRWASQLPEAYLPNPNVPEVGRWSAETGSDNEFCHKGSSPNPLPHPAGETRLPPVQSEQYMVRYDNIYKGGYGEKMLPPATRDGGVNHQEYADRCSDIDDKQHISDKYLFPYTAEEDHIPIHNNYIHPGSRLTSPITNDVNNPGGLDYHHHVGSHMGSRMGSVLGSVHGSICGSMRSSPSPLMPPVSMMHTGHHADPPQIEEQNEETPV